MTPLLEQFLSEARDVLQAIGEKLMELEVNPLDADLMMALFRMVHTLKGNSGLFDFPEMTRVLHAGEDLMDAVRHDRVTYSQDLADRLLDAMDFVGVLCDDIAATSGIGPSRAADATRLAASLRELVGRVEEAAGGTIVRVAVENGPASQRPFGPSAAMAQIEVAPPLGDLPEAVRADAHERALAGVTVSWVRYLPAPECFFQGEDPLFQVRGTPGILWGSVRPCQPWPALAELDAYHCNLDFHVLSMAPRTELEEHFRYMPDRVQIVPIAAAALAAPARTVVEGRADLKPGMLARGPALTSAECAAMTELLAAQREILGLPIEAPWHLGRVKAVRNALSACLAAAGEQEALSELGAAAPEPLDGATRERLSMWLEGYLERRPQWPGAGDQAGLGDGTIVGSSPARAEGVDGAPRPPPPAALADADTAEAEPKFGRRAEDSGSAKVVKVDQNKIDRLMNLIGEMVVSKNALPYLAARAETVFGARELSREIRAQYAVINRISEEMQDAIMQVNMMPVSFVFQRFPRLVRDISRKLGKEVNLVLEGGETEADKSIIESLADPLVHIVRNSLDHGFELPDVRQATGKPAVGRLTMRASQEADRVVIEISDDGKGIDPAVIRRKAYEKGLIDETTLESIGDEEAVNLVFASGFSTVDVVSDLSGRGVGMDVVKSAIDKVNGTVTLESEKGKGTRIRLSLPLSMAVTNVMIVESDGQAFGVPMDCVVETVRVPRAAIRTIKRRLVAVLRGRLVPLLSINTMLGIAASARADAEDQLAVLVVRLGDSSVGLVVDDFRETMDILLKPMTGILSGLSAYSGSALMGDGSVLMVLNAKEMLS